MIAGYMYNSTGWTDQKAESVFNQQILIDF